MRHNALFAPGIAAWGFVMACGPREPASASPPAPFVAMTWNTGSGGLPSVTDPDGWTPDRASTGDDHYGNGLAWLPAIERASDLLDALAPDLVSFQEIFDPTDPEEGCAAIPPSAHEGFVCERWRPGDPSVAEEILGEGWQVACFPGKSDKCLAVRTAWGTLRGCDGPRCDDVLRGAEVGGCGSGSRMGAGVVDTPHGPLTVVGVHGTSGVSAEDQDCRVRQVEAIFDDDAPLAAVPGVILGDLNTDPGRMSDSDPSAQAWLHATQGTGWSFASPLDPSAPATYLALPVVSIDHILSAGLRADRCDLVGIDDAPVPFPQITVWDHRPIQCALAFPPAPHPR